MNLANLIRFRGVPDEAICDSHGRIEEERNSTEDGGKERDRRLVPVAV